VAGLRHQLQDPIQVQLKLSVGSIRQGRIAQREVRDARGACEYVGLTPKLESEEWSDATVVRDDCEFVGLLPKLENEEQSDGVTGSRIEGCRTCSDHCRDASLR